MNTRYVWELPTWPELSWDIDRILPSLSLTRRAQGRLGGRLAGLGIDVFGERNIGVLTEETITTAAIEGEVLDPQAVRSSVLRRLGLPVSSRGTIPRHVEGLVDVLWEATNRIDEPLTADRIRSWHAQLFPDEGPRLRDVAAGHYRPPGLPMRVVSGAVGRETVHYEAPPGERVEAEMADFLAWFARSRGGMDGLLRAGLAHFRFVTIHPFVDGNGRLARAIGEMALAQDDGVAGRPYSLSAQIEKERASYYRVLEAAQKGTGDLTRWLEWFLGILVRAIERAEGNLDAVLAVARFWQRHAGKVLNERQVKVLRRVLDAGPGGFEGGLTTRKVAHLVGVSPATAQRDLADLVEQGIIVRNPGRGRGTSYRLVGDV